ncbi:hypothetical protein HCE06_003747, partial [Salmonella enterica subsp. enterica serovar Dublin]|nr:hypothetical protein [Salmonella enterica]ECW4916198.1 hypothetical protein [Salmonella enterica subsp. enterica serovar Dublin]EBB4973377.1 hypothetical protein [Salmonella enterica]EEP7104079.1 hypothetical protein [Salmonella enterica subsp. enterica serovar Dublin]EIJ4855239.1 hypothetical protein [Salmonella enterica subsp. enterica serovar Dublin]
MWHTLLNWPWGTVWSAVSALGSIVTVTLGFWAMNVWRRQEALKAKMALKMAVADYSNALSQLPLSLSRNVRIEKRAELRELNHKLNAVNNAFLICEHMLEKYPRVNSGCRSLSVAH